MGYDKYPLCHPPFSSFTHNHLRVTMKAEQMVQAAVRKALSLTLNPRLTDLGAQAHMQTIPAAPLLTPLSVQSSPSSSIFLDQTVDAAEKASHQSHRPLHLSSLSWLDDGHDEANDESNDERRLREKSHWSDDSDVDGEEVDGEKLNDEDTAKDVVTPANEVVTSSEETWELVLKKGGKKDMEDASVVEKTTDELVESNKNAVTDNARRLRRCLRRDGISTTQAVGNDARK